MNRYERSQYQRVKLERDLSGGGLYIFRNRTSGDLTLPKPTAKGSRVPIKPGEEFEGDSYFLNMVRTNELSLVRTIQAPQPPGVDIMNEQSKLILDQPPIVTSDGTIEHVVHPTTKGIPGIRTPNSSHVPTPVKPVNEQPTPPAEVLLTEDPLEGVDILID